MRFDKRIFLIFVILLVCRGVALTGDSISGETVSGEVITQPFSVSISVELSTPLLEIISPENSEEYFSGHNFLFNLSSSSYNSIWYNLNGFENRTLSELVFYENLSDGDYVLNVYANNSNGLSFEGVDFSVNSSSFFVDYSLHSNSIQGSSCTNFNYSSSSEIQNLSGVSFEKGNHGKISFLENINMTDDKNSSDNYVDLDSNILISSNRIEINSIALPNFNKSARLWLYNLSFDNPRILKDGEICSNCEVVSYSNGNLEFLVEGFSVYSAEEAPEDNSYIPPSSGGGSSMGNVIKEDLVLFEEDFLKAELKKGKYLEKKILIKNDNDFKIDFFVSVLGDESLVSLSNQSFSLNPGESFEYPLNFIGQSSLEDGVYAGKIVFSFGDFETEIPFIIELGSESALFDVSLKITSESQKISLNKRVDFEIEAFNFGDDGRVDVLLHYELRDFFGNVYKEKSESVAVETRASLSRSFFISEEMPLGIYVLSAELKYGNQTAVASDSFEVVKQEVSDKEKIYIVIILFLFIVVCIIVYFHLRHSGLRNRIKEMEIREVLKD